MTEQIELPVLGTATVTPTGQIKKKKTTPTYTLFPQTEELEDNLGTLCMGYDAAAPQFLMTAKFEEMLAFLRAGRKVRISIPTGLAMVDDLMVYVNSATKHAASKAAQSPSLYLYHWDTACGNFRQTRAI